VPRPSAFSVLASLAIGDDAETMCSQRSTSSMWTAERGRGSHGAVVHGRAPADAFAGDDPLFRHVRTRVRSPQTNGVVERFFGTLRYEHLYRATVGDGNALAVEANLFRHTYDTLRSHQALDERTPRAAYLAVERCG